MKSASERRPRLGGLPATQDLAPLPSRTLPLDAPLVRHASLMSSRFFLMPDSGGSGLGAPVEEVCPAPLQRFEHNV